MKNLKTYRMFESVTELTREQVQWLDDCTIGTWTLNPQTGLVDVDRFDCMGRGLTDLKGVKFGDVSGDFECSDNALTSLMGAPQSVGRSFYCNRNDLTSLVGAPRRVGWDFWCSYNQLTSLEGSPQRVGRGFWCSNNALTSLVGAPQEINLDFDCCDNALTSLEGAPLKVGEGFFYCEDNPVSEKTLEKIFVKMKKKTSYLAAVESLWSRIPQDDQVLLYADDFKWVSPEQGRGLIALRAYQDLRGML